MAGGIESRIVGECEALNAALVPHQGPCRQALPKLEALEGAGFGFPDSERPLALAVKNAVATRRPLGEIAFGWSSVSSEEV